MFGIRRIGQFVGPDPLAIRVDDVVRYGNGAARQRPRTAASPANDGTQRTSDISRLPRERKRVGERAAEDKDDGRQSLENGRAEIVEARTDAHDADVQGEI